jgi:hypothetical protein
MISKLAMVLAITAPESRGHPADAKILVLAELLKLPQVRFTNLFVNMHLATTFATEQSPREIQRTTMATANVAPWEPFRVVLLAGTLSTSSLANSGTFGCPMGLRRVLLIAMLMVPLTVLMALVARGRFRFLVRAGRVDGRIGMRAGHTRVIIARRIVPVCRLRAPTWIFVIMRDGMSRRACTASLRAQAFTKLGCRPLGPTNASVRRRPDGLDVRVVLRRKWRPWSTSKSCLSLWPP